MAEGPLLLGHRGARKYAPENTSEAFHLALEHGCDGFEFDVRLTSDYQPVICHDPKYRRQLVARSTYTRLFERCGELCTLENVLAAFHKTAFLNLEIKVVGGEELILEALKRFPPGKGIIISSFLPQSIERFHELGANFALGLICGNRRQLAKWKDLPIQAVMIHRALINRKLLDEIRTAPLKPKASLNGAPTIFVWTVNSVREMRKFASLGVDGIISDDTRLLAQTLRPDFVR